MQGAWLFSAVAELVAAQFYLLKRERRNFIFWESSSLINFGSLERKSVIVAKNEHESFHVPKTLILISCHFSEKHNMFLQNLLATYNCSLKTTSKFLANRTLLNTILTNNSLEVHEVPNPGYQEGASLALMYAFNNNLFESYDCAICLNPDVIICNDSRILAGIMNHAFDGIFANFILFQNLLDSWGQHYCP